MTHKIVIYKNREEMQQDKISKRDEGLRALHIDFVDNDESKGLKVTWVSGSDDPHNDPKAFAESEKNHTRKKRTRDLNQKLDDDTITDKEVIELFKLKGTILEYVKVA